MRERVLCDRCGDGERARVKVIPTSHNRADGILTRFVRSLDIPRRFDPLLWPMIAPIASGPEDLGLE